jgi:hypothetical protein
MDTPGKKSEHTILVCVFGRPFRCVFGRPETVWFVRTGFERLVPFVPYLAKYRTRCTCQLNQLFYGFPDMTPDEWWCDEYLSERNFTKNSASDGPMDLIADDLPPRLLCTLDPMRSISPPQNHVRNHHPAPPAAERGIWWPSWCLPIHQGRTPGGSESAQPYAERAPWNKRATALCWSATNSRFSSITTPSSRIRGAFTARLVGRCLLAVWKYSIMTFEKQLGCSRFWARALRECSKPFLQVPHRYRCCFVPRCLIFEKVLEVSRHRQNMDGYMCLKLI